MIRKRDDYSSFMLRLKLVQMDDLQTWIVSVQNTKTGHKLTFSGLDGLFQFLETEFGHQVEHDDPGPTDTQDGHVFPTL